MQIPIQKIRIFLFLLSNIFLCPIVIHSQPSNPDTVYSFSFNQNTIISIIDSLRFKTYLGVLYNPDQITSKDIYTKTFCNTPISIILDSTLSYFNLDYKIIGTTLTISRKQSNIPEITSSAHLKTDSSDFFTFSGQIKDGATGESLPYANIYIKDKEIGTISNTDGYFTLTISRKLLTDTVIFSYIGFQTITTSLTELKPDGNKISMKPAVIELKEVLVLNVNIYDVLKKTNENIYRNYNQSPRILTAFYRETLQQNNEYVALSEAILKIYKTPYNNYSNDQITIFKGRKSPFVKPMDTILFKLQGGIYNCLLIDIAKYPSNFMSGENQDLYHYTYGGMTSIQNHLAYVIEFDQKDRIPYSLYKGKLFIDTKSYAIIRSEFTLSPKGIMYAAETMVRKAPRNVKVKPAEAAYIVNYTEQNNLWHLGNIREELKIKVRKRYNLFNTTFDSVVELVITNSDSINVRRFKSSEIIKPNHILAEQLIKYDPDFWKSFNFIPPDKSLEEALEEIGGKLGIK